MTLTVNYGPGNSITKSDFPHGMTVGQLKQNRSAQAALGFGGNVQALIDGVVQPDHVTLTDGEEVTLETVANAKAS